MSDIIRNSIRTPDGTVLVSHSVHDYKTHVDANGEEYMVDGGLSYLRRNVNKEAAEELSLTLDDPHDILRTVPVWGTYGIDGDQPLCYVSVADMDTAHLEAVLDIKSIFPQIRVLMLNELKRRKDD